MRDKEHVDIEVQQIKLASMTIRVPLVLGFHCQYCITQVKQNTHKFKVQLLDLHEGQVYYE